LPKADPRAKYAKVIAASTKDNFRRAVPKTFSYRYEVAADAGPAGNPLVQAGAAIIESRYRGRGASWQVSRSPVATEKYTVNGGYIHPLPENPMAYPPRAAAPAPPRVAPQVAPRTDTLPTKRFDSRPAAAPAPAAATPAPAPIRRGAERPTPANEPAYRKTG
jgi:hypothetical protein